MTTEIIEKSMYNDTVKIQFYPNSHTYKKDWERIMSVTTITGVVDKSWPLIYWATNLAKEYLLDLNTRNPETTRITDEDIIRGCMMYKEKQDIAKNIGTLAH